MATDTDSAFLQEAEFYRLGLLSSNNKPGAKTPKSDLFGCGQAEL
jgi:hypothetical protein